MYTKTFLEEWVRDFGEFIGVDNTFKTQEAMKKEKESLGHFKQESLKCNRLC